MAFDFLGREMKVENNQSLCNSQVSKSHEYRIQITGWLNSPDCVIETFAQ